MSASEGRAATVRHGEGFTLIELLVVVAVISILASLLMPTVLRTMRQSAVAHCKSNLAQLGHGMVTYGNTFGNSLPAFGYWGGVGPNTGRAPFWTEVMAEWFYPGLTRNERLDKAVRCPVYTTRTTSYCRGYTCNYGNVFRYFTPNHGGNGPLHGNGSMLMTEIKRPSFVMLLMDGRTGFCYSPLIWKRKLDRDGDGLIDTFSDRVPLYNGGAPFRHDGHCVAVFADGHVKRVEARRWLTDDTLWDPYK